ncbi:MAG: hypothetical protein IPN79_03010 [Saprospiraceae bacterium]|jgi:hypothetical protein|nr:hypothetical protein [Saprospiraceae bacterium]
MKKWLLLIGLIGVIGAAVGYYMYTKPKSAMEDQKSDVVLESAQLVAEFEADEAAAELKYLDKTIEIKGEVKEITDSGIILESGNDMVGVQCEFEHPEDISSVKVKDIVKIKGICTGKLLDVVLSRCIIIQ